MAFGGQADGTYNELSKPFLLYNWEFGLHRLILLIDRLFKAQQFDQALAACHYVFNPMAKGDKFDMKRFWVFLPFKHVKTKTVEAFLQSF